jgi:hypothetical protein
MEKNIPAPGPFRSTHVKKRLAIPDMLSGPPITGSGACEWSGTLNIMWRSYRQAGTLRSHCRAKPVCILRNGNHEPHTLPGLSLFPDSEARDRKDLLREEEPETLRCKRCKRIWKVEEPGPIIEDSCMSPLDPQKTRKKPIPWRNGSPGNLMNAWPGPGGNSESLPCPGRPGTSLKNCSGNSSGSA